MQSRPPDLRRADSSATPQRRRHRQPTSVVPRVVRGSPVICRRVRRERHHLAAARSPHRRFAGSSPNGDDRRPHNPSPRAFPTSAGHSRGLCARSPDLRTARVTTAFPAPFARICTSYVLPGPSFGYRALASSSCSISDAFRSIRSLFRQFPTFPVDTKVSGPKVGTGHLASASVRLADVFRSIRSFSGQCATCPVNA